MFIRTTLDDLIEYDEDGVKYTKKDALVKRIQYRIRLVKKFIPHYDGGITDTTFSFYDDVLESEIYSVLKDLGLNYSINITKGRIFIADLKVSIPMG